MPPRIARPRGASGVFAFMRVIARVSRVGGKMIASVAVTAPTQPANCQPSSVTNITFGPGAAWPSAQASANCVALNQWLASTT